MVCIILYKIVSLCIEVAVGKKRLCVQEYCKVGSLGE